MIGGDKDIRVTEKGCWWEDGEYKCEFEYKDSKFEAGVTIADGRIVPGTKRTVSGRNTPTGVFDKAMEWLYTEVKK